MTMAPGLSFFLTIFMELMPVPTHLTDSKEAEQNFLLIENESI